MTITLVALGVALVAVGVCLAQGDVPATLGWGVASLWIALYLKWGARR